MSYKKAQAAVEFLVTYGWMIFILGLSLLFIFYLLFSIPQSYINEECNFNHGFSCHSQLFLSENKLKVLINITNLLHYKVNLDSLTFKYRGKEIKIYFSKELKSGESAVFSVSLDESSEGRIEKIDTVLSYYICASEINPNCNSLPEFKAFSEGKIIGKVY